MSSREYKSVMYCTQRLREFLDSHMLDKHGHKFPNIKHHQDYVSFNYIGEEFAVRLEIINGNCKKGRAHLEIKIDSSWQDLKTAVFDIKRSKAGRISDKTYIPLFDSFIIQGMREYLESKQ